MKIAIDARKITGTTGRYALELIKNLEQLDTVTTYTILVLKGEEDFFVPKNKNVQVRVADFAPYSFAEQIGFAAYLYRLKPDLVHFCMPQQPLLYTHPAVTTVHDLNLIRISSNDDMSPLELTIKKRIFSGLLRTVAKRAAHIITPSLYTKNDLIDFSHINSSKVTVTPEGSFEATVRPTIMPEYKNKEFILYVGRAEPYKNNRRLIQAHQQLLNTHPNLRLIIVGKKDILRRADIEWVKKNQFKNIDFTGFLPDSQLAWLYAHCQAHIAPSIMEGFGLPGLEAMAYGAPVISSNTTAQPEVYQDAAIYFDPLQVSDMARAIQDVLDSKQRRQALIKKGAMQYKKYSWRRMAEQTLQIYQQALKTIKTD